MYKQIAENKRRTVYIIIGFVVLISAIAGLFAWFYNDPTIAIWAVVVSMIYALFQYFAASSLAMAMTGAKEIQKKDNPRLYNIVENLSITTGLPMPKVYIINDQAPNAFATGRDPQHASVAATTGLISIMNDKEQPVFYWKTEYEEGKSEIFMITEVDLMRGRFKTINDDFSEYEWEKEKSNIYIWEGE